MALKSYAKQEEIPEAIRGDYVERDGRWIPDVEDAENLFAAGLKNSQQKLLKEVQDAKRRLAEYDGLDPVRAKELKKAAEEAEAAAAKAAGNWEAREKQLQEQFGKERTSLQERDQRLTRSLEKVLIENELRRALEKVTDSVDLALPHASKFVKMVESNGEFVAVVLDSKGNARIKDTAGNPFGIDDLAAEMSADKQFAPIMRGSGFSGSGGKGSREVAKDVKTIPSGDQQAFLDNAVDIAKGKVVVVP